MNARQRTLPRYCSILSLRPSGRVISVSGAFRGTLAAQPRTANKAMEAIPLMKFEYTSYAWAAGAGSTSADRERSNAHIAIQPARPMMTPAAPP